MDGVLVLFGDPILVAMLTLIPFTWRRIVSITGGHFTLVGQALEFFWIRIALVGCPVDFTTTADSVALFLFDLSQHVPRIRSSGLAIYADV